MNTIRLRIIDDKPLRIDNTGAAREERYKGCTQCEPNEVKYRHRRGEYRGLLTR